MSSNQEVLTQKLEEAIKARDEHVQNMGEEFSQTNMDKLSALQKAVATAKNELENAATQPDNTTDQESTSASGMCVVSLIRSGKSDRVVEVPEDTNVNDLMNTLGWPTNDFTFKRRVGPGQTVEITNLSTALGNGDHEIFVSPKVAGGVLR